MKQRSTRLQRRIGVIITFFTLFGAAILFEYCKSLGWTTLFTVGEIVLILSFIAGLIFTFFRTGLWQFTHIPSKDLDERELRLTNRVLRFSYSLLSIFLLVLLLGYSLISREVSSVVVFALIIFVHLLPAAVIAWSEKQLNLKE